MSSNSELYEARAEVNRLKNRLESKTLEHAELKKENIRLKERIEELEPCIEKEIE